MLSLVHRLQLFIKCGPLFLLLAACGDTRLPLSHTVDLTEEFSLQRAQDIDSFAAYLQLEERLFQQLSREVYDAASPAGDGSLQRYRTGSLADPRQHQPDWNRSFELTAKRARGAVLLLHGMSDSPYSLRALAEELHSRGYQVLGLRLPGHGTVPSGLKDVHWQDMSAAVDLAVIHLKTRVITAPLHIIGYSTGAGLALDYVLRAEQDQSLPEVRSLVLISPAIGISPAAALARWKQRLSKVPGLTSLAWLQVEPEFDPYKYNSFTTNAAQQVHELTRSVSRRIEARPGGTSQLPPMLVLKSTVDATVSNDAVIDRLLSRLTPGRHRLVLFDINRAALDSTMLIEDPAPFSRRLLGDSDHPFDLVVVSNTDRNSRAVSSFHKPAFQTRPIPQPLSAAAWPRGVFSLSHVALPFPPDDPLYGSLAPPEGGLFLGTQALQGERGLLKIAPDYLLRLRYNPFYDYLENEVADWLAH